MHPNFVFRDVYADIAVIELGRRIQYDYEKFGDSPSCLGKGREGALDGKAAKSHGYGITETGLPSNVLLEVNVTIINNGDCADYITRNASRKAVEYRKAQDTLRHGINEEVLCTTGNKKLTDDQTVIYSVTNLSLIHI